MARDTSRHFGATATTVRHVGAMPTMRVLKVTLGWSITLCGLSVLLCDVSATTAALMHGVASAILKAIA
ncbi:MULTISPECIES: hypothetical protein [unclassified Paraburkholderia]|uniref:hypothetical protein n=1 Tax=unclassified Paraburkholderia TaxID=2615204 RepID=UPI002AB6E939|nr:MULTISPECIES: hypothetical protein [unclassified Paraburkholderia]